MNSMSHILGAAPTGGHTRPPPNSADADDARPLGASATHWQFLASCHSAGYGRPSAHDARRLASLGVVHGGPETRHCPGNGCETRARSEKPPGEVPHGPMEKRGNSKFLDAPGMWG